MYKLARSAIIALWKTLLWINRHGIKKPLSPNAKLENVLLQSF